MRVLSKFDNAVHKKDDGDFPSSFFNVNSFVTQKNRQTSNLPIMERKTRFELATFTLAR